VFQVVSDDCDPNLDGNGTRTGAVMTSKVCVFKATVRGVLLHSVVKLRALRFDIPSNQLRTECQTSLIPDPDGTSQTNTTPSHLHRHILYKESFRAMLRRNGKPRSVPIPRHSIHR
jgi:hypothetical protein